MLKELIFTGLGGALVLKEKIEDELKKLEDKGKLDKDGFLTIVDRYSRFAKLGGEMISLGSIEEKIEDELKKLEDKGKIDTKDVKSFLESLEQKGKESDEKFKNELKSTLKEIIDELGLATKEDLQKLKEELK